MKIPVLLSPQLVLFCSPRDTRNAPVRISKNRPCHHLTRELKLGEHARPGRRWPRLALIVIFQGAGNASLDALIAQRLAAK